MMEKDAGADFWVLFGQTWVSCPSLSQLLWLAESGDLTDPVSIMQEPTEPETGSAQGNPIVCEWGEVVHQEKPGRYDEQKDD